MNYTVEKDKSSVKFTITLNSEEWEKAISQAYNKTKSKYFVQGFRKGHAPKRVIENIYGKGVFYEEAFNIALPQYYSEVLDKETDVFPVSMPDVDIKEFCDDGSIIFTADVTVKPEVKLGDYKGIKIKKIEYNVTDEDIDKQLKLAQERASRLVKVEGRPAQAGDTVTIDYSGSIDGKKFDGGTAEKQSLELGSKTFIPGFEEQLEGLNCGDNKDITVKFPDDYNKTLAGKEAVFNITLHEIKKKELPEINDEFAKDVSEFDTLEEYKKDIRKKLEEENARRAESETENSIIETVSASSEVDIPKVMIDSQIDSMVQDLSYRLMYQGMKIEDYLKYTKTTMEKLKESYREQAEKAVKTRLVIEEIIKKENITATNEEKDEKISDMAKKSNKSVEEFTKEAGERETAYIENEIIMDKLFKLLKDNAVIE
jgi:trigger factor